MNQNSKELLTGTPERVYQNPRGTEGVAFPSTI